MEPELDDDDRALDRAEATGAPTSEGFYTDWGGPRFYTVTVDFRVQADNEQVAVDDVQGWLEAQQELDADSTNLNESPLADYVVRGVA